MCKQTSWVKQERLINWKWNVKTGKYWQILANTFSPLMVIKEYRTVLALVGSTTCGVQHRTTPVHVITWLRCGVQVNLGRTIDYYSRSRHLLVVDPGRAGLGRVPRSVNLLDARRAIIVVDDRGHVCGHGRGVGQDLCDGAQSQGQPAPRCGTRRHECLWHRLLVVIGDGSQRCQFERGDILRPAKYRIWRATLLKFIRRIISETRLF